MKRTHINTKNLKAQEIYDGWGDFYQELATGWREKASKLQMRRWHKLRHQRQA